MIRARSVAAALPAAIFSRMGTLSLGGLTLPQLFRAEASAGIRSSQKSVILIYLVGGPPHQDMFDLKPNSAEGNRRPVAADRDQRPGHPDLRSLSAPRE